MQSKEDLYPTRVEGRASRMPRRDPIVYRNDNRLPGPLSEGEVACFEKNGFLFFEVFYSPAEVDMFNRALGELCASPSVRESDVAIMEPSGIEVRSIFGVTMLNHVFFTLSREARIVDAVRQLLGDEVYIHQSRVNRKPGFEGKEFYWHSDFETWHAEDGMPRMRAISCSVNFTENNEFNGPLMVIPGSHHTFVSCSGRTPDNHYKSSLRKQEYGVPDRESLGALANESGIVAPKGPAGSVLLFDCNLMHGSAGNISPYPRSNVFFVYNAVSNTLVEPFDGTKPRPEFVASRDFSAITPVVIESTYAAL